MQTPTILYIYLGRTYAGTFLGVFFLMSGIVFLGEYIELLRRAAHLSLPLALITKMALLKVPNTLQEAVPFIFLFATMAFVWRLNRHSETLVLKSIGLSIWRILIPLLVIVGTYTFLEFSLVNPLGARFMEKFEQMDHFYLKQQKNIFTISTSGIWLKETREDGYTLIQVARIDGEKNVLGPLTLYEMSGDDIFKKRLDASGATIYKNTWALEDVTEALNTGETRHLDHMNFKTSIDLETLRNRFLSPDTLSFWQLPSFIHKVQAAGLSTTAYSYYWFHILMRPVLFVAMIFIGLLGIYQPNSRASNRRYLWGSIAIAFLLYLIEHVLRMTALSLTLPVALAACTQGVIGVLLGLSLLLHLEEKR